MIFHYRPTILGYPHLWKPPNQFGIVWDGFQVHPKVHPKASPAAAATGWSCHEPFAHPLAKARDTEEWPDVVAVCSAGMVLVERAPWREISGFRNSQL